jgi:hypothetical protein
MTNFIWTIISMPSYPQEGEYADVVFEVNWQCQAQEVNADSNITYQAISSGTVPVTYEAGSSFTPYAQLTQEQVWGWIDPSIDRSEIEANLQTMIDEQKAPAVVTPPLPWAGTQQEGESN